MEIVWKNLKVTEFSKICRLCLANKELEPLAEEEKSTLVKLTPWIAQLETSVFFPNKICSDCAKQLQQANEFLNRCNTLSNSFHKCIEDYKICAKEDSRLPSLEALLFPTKVTIKQEVEQIDESEEDISAPIPFTEVFVSEDVKKEEFMEFEDTKFVPQQTTSNSIESSSQCINSESVESTPDIPDENVDSYNELSDDKNTELTVGLKFSSYTELKEFIATYEAEHKQKFYKHRSRTIKSASRSLIRPLTPCLEFYELEYACIHGQERSTRGTGLRKTSSQRLGCKAKFRLRICPEGKYLKVITCNLEHTGHKLSNRVFDHLPRNHRELNETELAHVQNYFSLNPNKQM